MMTVMLTLLSGQRNRTRLSGRITHDWVGLMSTLRWAALLWQSPKLRPQ